MRHNMKYSDYKGGSADVPQYTDEEIGLNKVDKSGYLMWVVALMILVSVILTGAVYNMLKQDALVTKEIKASISQMGGDHSKVSSKLNEIELHIQDNNSAQSTRESRMIYQNQQTLREVSDISKRIDTLCKKVDRINVKLSNLQK